jgi:outer membrane protein OmpA-like peptidoglycan-associated protein
MLGLALLYATGRPMDHRLLSWINPPLEKLRSQLSSLSAIDAVETNPKTGPVPYTTAPFSEETEQDAPATLAGTLPPHAAEGSAEATPPEETIEAPAIDYRETTSTVPIPDELEDVQQILTRNGLRVERIDETTLKVNLSSEGMFDIGSAQIKPAATPALQKLSDVMLQHERTLARVVGHTDSSGTADYNLYLSERRAEAVADCLIGLGLPEARIQSEGRGDRDTRLEPATPGRSVALRSI